MPIPRWCSYSLYYFCIWIDEHCCRGEDEQDDLDEKVTLQLPDQEEEDFNRVKEESRRRREAILEKYKKQHQQIELNTENEGKGIFLFLSFSFDDSFDCIN